MTNKKITLPADLEEYTYKARRKNNIRILACAFLFVLCAYFLYLNAPAILKPEHRSTRIFISLVLMSLPFLITGFPHKTTDKTYVGRVEKSTVKTTYTGNGAKFNRQVHFINTIYLTITTPDGKQIKKKVYSANANQKQAYSLYKIGDTVFHLYGTQSVVVLPTKKDTHFECAVCEDVNEIENTVCRSCGHTLIKNADSLFCDTNTYSEY